MTDSTLTQSTHWDGCHKVHDHGPPEGDDMTDSEDAPESVRFYLVQAGVVPGHVGSGSPCYFVYQSTFFTKERLDWPETYLRHDVVEETVRSALERLRDFQRYGLRGDLDKGVEALESLLDEEAGA